MNAIQKLGAGDLRGAIDAAKQGARDKPGDIDNRTLLCQLLCFAGDWERADKQFEILGQQKSDLLVGVGLLRQLIRAEIARNQFYDDGRVPELVAEPDQLLDLQLKALISMREKNNGEALDFVNKMAELAPELSGEINGNPFVGARNLDDLTSCFFEVLTTNGKYYLIPMAQVHKIQFRETERIQDQIWRSANIEYLDGFSGEVYFPVRYRLAPGDLEAIDEQLKLGRSTDWIGGSDSPVTGAGQMMFLFGDDASGILELQSISFDG